METLSLVLIIAGLAVLAWAGFTWLKRGREQSGTSAPEPQDTLSARTDNHNITDEFDPLDAVLKEDQRIDEEVGKLLGNTISGEARGRSKIQPKTRMPNAEKLRSADIDASRLIVLNVIARERPWFAGADVEDVIRGTDMEFGDMDIFHYRNPDNPEGPSLFSLANMVKPGYFDRSQMRSALIPGLSLFMIPTGKRADAETFEIMLETARRIAQHLNGELCDGQRNALTKQTTEHMREQITEWFRKSQVAT